MIEHAQVYLTPDEMWELLGLEKLTAIRSIEVTFSPMMSEWTLHVETGEEPDERA